MWVCHYLLLFHVPLNCSFLKDPERFRVSEVADMGHSLAVHHCLRDESEP